MKTHQYGLKSFIHRKLIGRLLLGGTLIAVILGTTIYFTRHDYVGDAAITHAINSIEQLKLRVRLIRQETGGTLTAATQQALDEGPSYRVISPYGHFVYGHFYTPDGNTLAERAIAEQTKQIQFKNFLQASQLHFPELDETWRNRIDIDGRPYIHVVIPIADSEGVLAAYGEGLYALSDLAISNARITAFRIAAFIILIVIATSFLLYPVIITLTNRLTNFSERLLASNLETIQLLGNAIAKRDSDTDAHNYRVTLYSVHLAEAAGLDTETIRGLIKGAFLHDVGKIGIRDNILHKPGQLDDKEFEIMKTHVNHGLEIIHRSNWLQDATDIVGAHHEKYDGSGYPSQLDGDNIPIAARIFSITDVFDALTSRRPYKQPFSFNETMQILEQSRGTHFDPSLLDLFIGLADDLYKHYGGREDERLHQELAEIVHKYFTVELNTLVN